MKFATLIFSSLLVAVFLTPNAYGTTYCQGPDKPRGDACCAAKWTMANKGEVKPYCCKESVTKESLCFTKTCAEMAQRSEKGAEDADEQSGVPQAAENFTASSACGN